MPLKHAFGVLLFMALSNLSWAHDLMASYVVAQLKPDTIELQIKIAADSIWPLVQELNPEAIFVSENFETQGKPLLRAFGKTMHEVIVDGKTTSPLRNDVILAEDSFLFTFTYARPSQGILRLRETYLQKMSVEYSSYVSFCDQTGAILAMKNLNSSNIIFESPLPANKPENVNAGKSTATNPSHLLIHSP